MNLIGTPQEWGDLLDSLIPDILDLIVSTWQEMPAPAANAREDPTTEELCRWLCRSRNSRNLPLQIRTQVVELDPNAGEDQGRMDIAFLPMVPREDIYFCLECKRLNVVQHGKVRSYASEYLTHGMLRLVRGQYAARVKNGAMLAYVLDGDVANAILNVNGLIKKRHQELQIQPPSEMYQSSIRPDDSMVRETRHLRSFTPKEFVIHHIFAGVES